MRKNNNWEFFLKLDGDSERSLVQAGINKGNHVQSTLYVDLSHVTQELKIELN